MEVTTSDRAPRCQGRLLPHLEGRTNAGVDGAVRTRIRALVDDPSARSGFVASVIGKEMGLD